MKRALLLLAGSLWAAAALAGDKKAAGEFSATASIGTPTGTRSMAFDVVVSNPRGLAEMAPLKKVLEDGGQQALVNAIRGSGQGQIKLGALVYPVDLVMVEKIEDGWRYFIVTTRPIKYTESEEDGGASLNYPVRRVRLRLDGLQQRATGSSTRKAALSIDPDGHVQVSQYDGDPGSLSDIRRLN